MNLSIAYVVAELRPCTDQDEYTDIVINDEHYFIHSNAMNEQNNKPMTDDAFKRYLPITPFQSATTLQPIQDKACSQFKSATRNNNVAFKNSSKALVDKTCSDVAFQNPTPKKHYTKRAVKYLSTVLFLSLAIASCSNESYANGVHPHDELVLADYKISLGAQSTNRAFFVRTFSMHSHISMAKLERDTFTCAGNLVSLSANPFQFCHLNYLAVNGKTPLSLGAH